MKASNGRNANEYHTEIVSGGFDDLQPRQIRSEPIRTIAYDRENQYEEGGNDRIHQNTERKQSKCCSKQCLIGLAIGLLIGIILVIVIAVPVGVVTRTCSLGTISSTPNWIGQFLMDNACDTSICCCFTNQVTLSQVTNGLLQVSGSVTGLCTGSSSTVSLTQSMPTGFQTLLIWSAATIRLQLGQDNSYISFVTLSRGSCSASGLRTSYNSGSMTNINLSLIIFILLINIGIML